MNFIKKNSSDSRIVRILKSALLIIFFIILILIISTLIIGISVERAKFPSLLSNRNENIKNIQSNVDPNKFTFIVMGDPKDGTNTFESLLDIAILEKPSFILLLGDLVNHRTSVDHKLFAYEISDYASKIPFLITPGNHDISIEDNFRVEDFKQTYGPDQFYFTIGSNLFVMLNNLPEYNQNGEYIDFLEKTLRANQPITKKTFVFMHIPLAGLNDLIIGSEAPYPKRFMEVAKKYHIDYVFFGHHHGYIKTIKDGTTYIVSGGGGSKLRGTKGGFYHFDEMNVENDSISETIISVKHKHDGLELLERNIVIYFWGTARENKVVFAMGVLYCCAAVFTLLVFLKRKKK